MVNYIAHIDGIINPQHELKKQFEVREDRPILNTVNQFNLAAIKVGVLQAVNIRH